jgi:hypothetical protein
VLLSPFGASFFSYFQRNKSSPTNSYCLICNNCSLNDISRSRGL